MCSIERRYDMQRGTEGRDEFKLVDGTLDVTMETETPDLEHCLHVKQDGENNLMGKTGNISHFDN